ncbi:hypothetical protein ACSBR2_016974 [Camellia fascicularis]
MDQTPHVAFLPIPSMGHLIPFIESAKQLVQNRHFSVTILIPSAEPPTKAQKKKSSKPSPKPSTTSSSHLLN